VVESGGDARFGGYYNYYYGDDGGHYGGRCGLACAFR
jgi:hypothetical protein